MTDGHDPPPFTLPTHSDLTAKASLPMFRPTRGTPAGPGQPS